MTIDYFKGAKAEPKHHQGAPIPLFERLINEDPLEESEYPSKRFYSQTELVDSITQEVSRILGTRGTLKKEDLKDIESEILNCGYPPLFGLSDFSHYDGSSFANYPKIAQLCQDTIRRYEPRLKDIKVIIKSFDRHKSSLHGEIYANLSSAIYQGEVTFPMTLKI